MRNMDINENINTNKSAEINKNRAAGFRKLILLGILSMILFLSGCGALPASDEVMQTQLQTDIAQIENQEDDAEENTDTPSGNEAKSSKEITEEEKEELIVEMLQSADMDVGIVQSSKATKGCTFEPPEDFEEAEDMPGMYVSEHYPVDASTIYYTEKDKDSSLQLMTEQNFIKYIKEELREVYGHEVEVKLETFEQTKINGYPSFRILYSYKGDDVTITQLEYIINADKSYVVVYSQTDEYDRMEEFEASAATIQIKF